MSNKITVSPDKSGRYIVKLYGSDIEIDKSMFVKGKATIKQFGDEYIIVKAKETKKEDSEISSDKETEK